jgi:hypothetical protein
MHKTLGAIPNTAETFYQRVAGEYRSPKPGKAYGWMCISYFLLKSKG